jgi:enoyl-CoA hydratase/carnithine racemase
VTPRSTPDLVQLDVHEHACVVTLTREAKLNAISGAMERALCAALERSELRESPCVIFTGGPRVFSAGADVNEMRGLGPAAVVAHYRATGDFAERVADLPQPSLSAISGYCIGGGLELALACDFRIAGPDAVFGLPEVELGILPSWGGTVRLVQLLGTARAKELILLRTRFDAHEAFDLGLLTEIVQDGPPLQRALELAGRLAALPPLAVQVTREVIDSIPETSRRSGLALERLAYGLLAQTAEHDSAAATRLAR